MMNIILWILQGVLAALILMAGFMKAFTPKKQLEEKMAWTKDFQSGTLKFIGLTEMAGAVGLILPWLLNIMPVLTSVAAFALALVMLLAIGVHAKRKEQKEAVMNVVLMLLLLLVGIFRLL
jgi:hypothetical protein